MGKQDWKTDTGKQKTKSTSGLSFDTALLQQLRKNKNDISKSSLPESILQLLSRPLIYITMPTIMKVKKLGE